MSDAYAVQAHNSRMQYQSLAGGHIARRVEGLRQAGISAHHPAVLGNIEAYQAVEAAIARETQQLRLFNKFTPEDADRMTKDRADALAAFDKFADWVLSLPKMNLAAFALGKPQPLTNEQVQAEQAKINAAQQAARQAAQDAEQAIVDAVTHAIDTVTEAGGYLTIVTYVKGPEMAGHPSTDAKGVYVVGIPDVSALDADVRQTILAHGQRLADELLRRQAAALAAPAPVVAEVV
jgi:hypothetical protein